MDADNNAMGNGADGQLGGWSVSKAREAFGDWLDSQPVGVRDRWSRDLFCREFCAGYELGRASMKAEAIDLYNTIEMPPTMRHGGALTCQEAASFEDGCLAYSEAIESIQP